MRSSRNQLAETLATKICDLGLTNPYGGEVTQDMEVKGKPYRIGFSSPRYLDGEISVYGSGFIKVLFETPSQGRQNIVVESEGDAIAMLEAISKFDWEKVNSIPRKIKSQ